MVEIFPWVNHVNDPKTILYQGASNYKEIRSAYFDLIDGMECLHKTELVSRLASLHIEARTNDGLTSRGYSRKLHDVFYYLYTMSVLGDDLDKGIFSLSGVYPTAGFLDIAKIMSMFRIVPNTQYAVDTRYEKNGVNLNIKKFVVDAYNVINNPEIKGINIKNPKLSSVDYFELKFAQIHEIMTLGLDYENS